LHTKGSPSAALTGFKSFLLKGLTAFMKRDHGVKSVPFQIAGKYHHASVNLDLGQEKKPAANH
jgi:hypothetical protein